MRRDVWIVAVLLAGMAGGCCGGMVGVARHNPFHDRLTASYPELIEYAPLPHHVPKTADGLSFRFAMVHDVVHERFARHGQGYHRERNRVALAKLKDLRPDVQSAFALTDDVAAGLDRLGKSDEAVALMREKLKRQRAAGLDGGSLYTSYANLGTFLMHDNLDKAAAGDEAARERFREGTEFIRKSVEVNPNAHFGREQWQAAYAEFLLAAMDKPELLKTFDFLGNRLDESVEDVLNKGANKFHRGYGRPYKRGFAKGEATYVAPAFYEPGATDDPTRWEAVSPIRQYVTVVGAEDGWEEVDVPSHRKPVAFDEPCLGIVGMWRQGGGANPHFALALAETMLRAGQRYVAWTAYERAARLAERFWPDDDKRRFLRDHCRRRQTDIEATMTHRGEAGDWQHVSPRPPDGTVEKLRPTFEAELTYGEGYQKAYQDYEAEKLRARGSIEDKGFFDAFYEGRDPIASPTGPEEAYPYVPRAKLARKREQAALAWGALGAGVTAMLASVVCWWLSGRR